MSDLQPEGSSGDAPEASGRRCDEVRIVVSDLHLSEGEIRRVKPRRSPWQRFRRWATGRHTPGDNAPFTELRNPLEDFPHDEHFASFLELLPARYAEQDSIVLHLQGDVWDPLVVTWFGRFEDPPYETVGVRKMRKIMAGHPKFFDAIAAFIRKERCKLVVFVGNHDQFLVWPHVQQELTRRLAGNDPELAAKISYVDQRTSFELEHRGVLYYHGNNAEMQNRIDADTAVLTDFLGVKLKRPMLNKPDGSYMVERVVNRIKLRNELVGRVNKGSDMWMYIFCYHRWWGIFAGLMVVWDFIYRRISFWDVRRKTSLKSTAQIIFSTVAELPVDKYAEKMLKDRPHLKAVVLGHSHEWRLIKNSHGTYSNSGTWSLCYELFVNGDEVLWSRQILKLTAYWVAIMFVATMLWMYSPVAGWNLLLFHLKGWEAAATLVFAYTLVFTFFPLLSERPRIVPISKLTFSLVKYYDDESIDVDTMEYVPAENMVKECV